MENVFMVLIQQKEVRTSFCCIKTMNTFSIVDNGGF